MFEELKKSWKDQEAKNLPDVKTLWKAIRKERNTMLRKSIIGICALMFTVFVFCLIAYVIPFKYTMTKVSMLVMGLIMLVAVGYLVFLRRKIPTIHAAHGNSKDYIQDWVVYQQELKRYSSFFMNFYIVLLIVGMAIYLFEVTEGSMSLRLIAYGGTAIWFLIFWFYVKPRWTKQSEARVQIVIDHYEKIHSQI